MVTFLLGMYVSSVLSSWLVNDLVAKNIIKKIKNRGYIVPKDKTPLPIKLIRYLDFHLIDLVFLLNLANAAYVRNDEDKLCEEAEERLSNRGLLFKVIPAKKDENRSPETSQRIDEPVIVELNEDGKVIGEKTFKEMPLEEKIEYLKAQKSIITETFPQTSNCQEKKEDSFSL